MRNDKLLGFVHTTESSVMSVPISASVAKEARVEYMSNSLPYVSWGAGNNLPFLVTQEIERNEILVRANNFNKSIHVGGGLIYYKEVISGGQIRIERFDDPEIEDWLEENMADYLWKNIVENYETLGMPVTEMLTTTDRNYIARMVCKDTAWCRWEKQNSSSMDVENLYYHADWRMVRNINDLLKISALNSKFPLQDLLSRRAGSNFIFRIPPIENNRFYYPLMNAEVLLNSGTLDIYSDIKRTIRALLKNQSTIIWQIEVFEQYFIGKLGQQEWQKICNDPIKREAEFAKVQSKIDKYLAGADNAGKSLMTGAVYDKQGKPLSGIIVKPLNNAFKDGAWIPDQQQAINDIYAGYEVDPSSVGGFQNKERTMNSGSEKESSFWNSSSTMFTERLVTFMPFYFVARVNGWTKRHKRFRWGVADMNVGLQMNTPKATATSTPDPQNNPPQ